MLFLARWARKLSWKETAEAFRTSWEKVFDAVEHVVAFGLEHRVLARIDAIGVDEIQYAKGHKYLTLVYQIDLGITRLLWVGRERTVESFQGFFTIIGDELASKIVFACSDMWEPYLKVIRERCSEALHILDRFHIVAKMNKALDEVRAGESRQIASEGGVPVLKKSRWLLLKREENLKTEQRFRLRDLLRYNLKTVRAYLLKEAFQQLWDYNSATWAGKFLDAWCRQVMRSRIEPMKKIARSIRQHRELILNYFRAQKLLSSGVVEGLNNKAKVTMRKSYGFRTFRALELALYHSLGKLPELRINPRFFLTNLPYHRQIGVDIRIVRIFNTYGPRMAENDGRVVSNFVLQALRNQDITVYGDGSQTRSFCYVSDLVEGMIRMMECDGFIGPVNLGNPVENTILEFAEKIITITKSRSKIIFKPLP